MLINMDNLLTLPSLFVKIVGTTLSVMAMLAIGKEGPLAHIGGIIGPLVLYLPFRILEPLRTERIKRELTAAGAAAGVAAAFGAPIGGVLFAFEMSKPSAFWSFELTWKIFFSTSLGSFTLSVLVALTKGEDLNFTNSGTIKFGEFSAQSYAMQDFPFFILLGVMGGLIGACFIFLNFEINQLRKKYLTNGFYKLVETLFVTILTVSVYFFVPMWVV